MPLQPLPDASGKIAEQAEQYGRLHGKDEAELRGLPADMAVVRNHELRQEGKKEQDNLGVDCIGQ